jgi:hypothetical protein
MEQALEAARKMAKKLAKTRATNAGATDVTIEVTEDVKLVPIGSKKDLFMEASVNAVAVGKPG